MHFEGNAHDKIERVLDYISLGARVECFELVYPHVCGYVCVY